MSKDVMKRREFLTLLGGAAAASSGSRNVGAQPAVPVIGYLGAGGPPTASILAAIQQGLGEMGFVEGRNVAIEVRATAEYERLPGLAADLVQRRVAVILGIGAANAALVAKSVTATTPIIMATGADPVEIGLVASLARPGGNVTGVVFFSG